MADDDVEALRNRLARLTGPARTRALIELGQRLADRYWRVGPGNPQALPHLDEAVGLLDEAYGYFEPGAVMRGQVAGMLGWLVGTRYLAHGSAETDRETGIRMLDESLSFTQLPLMLQVICRLALGQLLLGRLTRALQSGDLMTQAMRSGLPRGEVDNATRAADCFRRVVQDPSTSADIVTVAEPLLALAEAMQTLVGAVGQGAGGVDLSRVQQAITAIQAVQRQVNTVSSGDGGLPGIFQAQAVATAHPLDRPVAVVDGPAPPTPVVAPQRRPQAPLVDAAELRTAFRERLPGTPARLFPSVLALLQDGAERTDVDTVDELVALASSLVGAPGHGTEDHLLLAAGLYLRSRIDSGGWADGDGGDDRRAAAESLTTAADALPGKRADAVGVAFRLATLLDEKNPAGELRTRVGDGFAKVTDAMRAIGADVLLYPQPGPALLLVASTGRFELASPRTPLPPRVLIAGDGTAPDAIVSYVRSGSQLVDLAGRPRRAITEAPVFVANPRGDRAQATADAMLLRRAFYPRSVGLGRVVENVDGPGTVDEVRVHLRASMLHLGCGITAGGELELAGGAQLGLRQISAGSGRPGRTCGLAVLPPTVGGAAALTGALLAANYSSVIGWRIAVPADVASLVYHLLHLYLVEERHDVASAVSRVRRWLRDPYRKPPPRLPAEHHRVAGSAELTDPACASALVHHGVW